MILTLNENKQKFTLLKDETRSVNGKTLYRIKYLVDIPYGNVKPGTLGGWLESESNLSQEGQCCVLDNAVVMDSAVVKGELSMVKGNAIIDGRAVVDGYTTIIQVSAYVSYKAKVVNSVIKTNAIVNGNAEVTNSLIQNQACVTDRAKVTNSIVTNSVKVCNRALVENANLKWDKIVKW